MTFSVDTLIGTGGTDIGPSPGELQQRQELIRKLQEAILSGDMATARRLMAEVMPGQPPKRGPLANIAAAIQQQNAAAAQSALAAMQTHRHEPATPTEAPHPLGLPPDPIPQTAADRLAPPKHHLDVLA